MINTFKSNFSVRIENFIKEKHAAGYSYDDSQRILQRFDEFCLETYPESTTLVKELVLAWAEQRPSESPSGFRHRLQPIREFGRYLIRQGENAYVIPTNLAPKGVRYTPHIFTEEELRCLFAKTDEIPVNDQHPLLPYTVSTIFRLIYCCGLRPGEARRLKTDEVDVIRGLLRISESKGHKDRDVPLSTDVTELCRKYHRLAEVYMPNREYFFSYEPGFPSKDWLKYSFRKIWAQTGIMCNRGHRPRTYDLRHTFATNKLMCWMNEGRDLSVCLPYLSAYLGHALLSDTAYYLHLCPDLLPKAALAKYGEYQRLIPEVGEYE
jgi:integrase